MTEEERYARAWKDLKRRKGAGWIVSLLTGIWILWILVDPSAQPTGILDPILLPLMIVGSATTLWYIYFRCPRCGNFFFFTLLTRSFTGKRCMHCKLPRGAPYDRERDIADGWSEADRAVLLPVSTPYKVLVALCTMIVAATMLLTVSAAEIAWHGTPDVPNFRQFAEGYDASRMGKAPYLFGPVAFQVPFFVFALVILTRRRRSGNQRVLFAVWWVVATLILFQWEMSQASHALAAAHQPTPSLADLIRNLWGG